MLIAVTGMGMAVIRAQEPVTVTGSFTHSIDELSNLDAGRIFIREQARVAVPTSSHGRSIYTLELDEESAQKAGEKVIGVVFVNNVSHLAHRDLDEDVSVAFDVYPLGRGLFYCKDYTPKNSADAHMRTWYNCEEMDTTRYLERAALGDTLKFGTELMVDSRYTRQLIKNLSNDNVFYEEKIIHGDGVRVRTVRFLGIRIKEKREPFSSYRYYYKSIRMSEFAREKLEEIFRQQYWDVVCPERGASAEEWQAWLDDLLNRGYTTPVDRDEPGGSSDTSSQSPKPLHCETPRQYE